MNGWRSKCLSVFLHENPNLSLEYGFHTEDSGLGRYTAEPPKQSRLWEMWHKEFSEPLREACRYIAKHVVEEAPQMRYSCPGSSLPARKEEHQLRALETSAPNREDASGLATGETVRHGYVQPSRSRS